MSSIAKRDVLLKEMAAIQLANEKRVAQANQVTEEARGFNPAAIVEAAKAQLAAKLDQAKTLLDVASSEADHLVDLEGRYQELFSDIKAAAIDNPDDLVSQYQKSLLESFINHAVEHKVTISNFTQDLLSEKDKLIEKK
jgi:hypothetical protein